MPLAYLRAVRLEEECAVIEALCAKRVVIKDAFRSYASSALTEITALDKISIGEIRTFVKDMRFSSRVTIKLPQIFYTTLNSAVLFSDGRPMRGEEESMGACDNDDDRFVGCVERLVWGGWESKWANACDNDDDVNGMGRMSRVKFVGG